MQLSFNRELYISYPRWEPGRGMSVEVNTYTALTGYSLIQLWFTSKEPDFYFGTYVRRSEDNGRTWTVSEMLHEAQEVRPAESDEVRALLGLREDEDPCSYTKWYGNEIVFLDPDNSLLVMVYFMDLSITGEQIANGQLIQQISRDEGRSWSEPQQIIQEGNGYDARHWAKEIELGQVGGIVAGVQHMEKTADGVLLLPFQIGYGGPGQKGNRWYKQGVFLGRWREDLSGIDWDVGDYVSLPADRSSIGCLAGTLAVLDDGRIMMVMRGTAKGTDSPGDVKWLTVSADGGSTWEAPRPLQYDDGSTMWSASSNSRLFRSSKNGRVYLITHMLDEPKIASPRYPLHIAEIDPEKLAVRKDTVTLLANRDERDSADAYYEPRGVYEDRENGNLVMIVGGGIGKPGTIEQWRYDVQLP